MLAVGGDHHNQVDALKLAFHQALFGNKAIHNPWLTVVTLDDPFKEDVVLPAPHNDGDLFPLQVQVVSWLGRWFGLGNLFWRRFCLPDLTGDRWLGTSFDRVVPTDVGFKGVNVGGLPRVPG